MAGGKPVDERLLVVAPTGADAANIHEVLSRARLPSETCSDLGALSERLAGGAGALVITEEALNSPQSAALVDSLNRQPAWSDIPILLVATNASINWWALRGVEKLGPRSNIILVERPLRGSTLVAAARAVLRARRRQYQIRDLLLEREALLKSLESRVVERTAKLQLLVSELEAFSYSVSHDLRAPLRVIGGYARAITEDHGASLKPEVKNYLERITQTAERMDRLTRDILAYTRLTRSEIKMEPIDLDVAVGELIDQYPALVDARRQIRVQRPLGWAMGHGPSLIQALSNLLENAIKFVPARRTPRVKVWTKTQGGRIRIHVSDNGVGIAPEHHEKIFGIFERLADRSVPGTGIGLAIVKKAAERMGGRLGLASQPGKGSTFWIELPRPASTVRGRRAGEAGGKRPHLSD